jgi:hypothetical protein
MGVDGESGALAGPDAVDVGLVDLGVDLHPAQVLSEGEQDRRLQAGGHGLTTVDVAPDHHPVDRRPDNMSRATISLF